MPPSPIDLGSAPAAIAMGNEGLNYRSLANIIQSCLFTIVACVWTSVHPNMPGPNDSDWQFMRRRMLTMVYGLIAPEIVAIWALRQYFAAQRIADMHNLEFCCDQASSSQMSAKSSGFAKWHIAQRVTNFFGGTQDRSPRTLSNNPRWSKTHGFFVQMGGFLLYNSSGSPTHALDYDTLAQLLREGAISPSEISLTEREIYDRSKGDSISKGLVVLQTTWFIVQGLCRIHAGLSLSGVDVLTFAFAVVNGGMYAIWWEKPQGVEVSIPVRMRIATREVGVGTEDKINPHEHDNANLPESCGVTATTTGKPCKAKAAHYIQMQDELSNHTLKPFCALLPMVSIFCSSSLRPLQKMALSETIPENALRVPMFYAHPKWRENTPEIVFAGPIIGAVFGAVHLLAWSSTFPTSSEQILWRVAAGIVTAAPTLIILLGLLGHTTEKQKGEARYAIPSLVFTSTIPFYVIARLMLIVLACTSLRALPQQALIQISWVSFIPHL